jgi:hypothetical protein
MPLTMKTSQSEFFAVKQLANLAAKIKRAAKGRVCRDCKHLRDGWCAEKTNVAGDALVVLYPTAVACGQHEAR